MCRFVAYKGSEEQRLADVLIKPSNSLIKQSLLSQESRTITNGDGFGLGWYTLYDKEPALFTSLFPAWSDQNLQYLAKRTRAALFFAHVRAASTGGITQYNCHPFIFRQWMFMHNGYIPHFTKIKRKIFDLLDDDLYNWVKGSTDSELIFALFMQLAKNENLTSLANVAHILKKTLDIIQKLVQERYPKSSNYFNICLTDGRRIVAFRYCTSLKAKPDTMYLSIGENFWGSNQNLFAQKLKVPHIVIASEKLSKSGFDWHPIPANHCLLVEADLQISFFPLNEQSRK